MPGSAPPSRSRSTTWPASSGTSRPCCSVTAWEASSRWPSRPATPSWRPRSSPTNRPWRGCRGGPSASAGAAALTSPGEAADAAERFMRRMVGDARWEELPQRTRDQRRAEGPALVAELRSIRPPAPPPYDPSELEVPVLAAHGSESRPHHQRTARRPRRVGAPRRAPRRGRGQPRRPPDPPGRGGRSGAERAAARRSPDGEAPRPAAPTVGSGGAGAVRWWQPRGGPGRHAPLARGARDRAAARRSGARSER